MRGLEVRMAPTPAWRSRLVSKPAWRRRAPPKPLLAQLRCLEAELAQVRELEARLWQPHEVTARAPRQDEIEARPAPLRGAETCLAQRPGIEAGQAPQLVTSGTNLASRISLMSAEAHCHR